MQSLKETINALMPGNLGDVTVLKDTIEIFTEILEELSRESIDIFNREDNLRIKEQVVKTYLSDFYGVLDGIQRNQKLIDIINRKNSLYKNESNTDYEYVNPNISNDIIKDINDEHFLAFNAYREKKGTIAALEYIYTLVSTLVNIDEQTTLTITEGKKPFELIVDGVLPEAFYYYLVSPLARPFGFTTDYSELLELKLEDRYFPGLVTYEVLLLEVVCLVKDPDNPLNSISVSTDFSNREVIDVYEYDYKYPKIKKITFGGEHLGEYLEQKEFINNQIEVIHVKDGIIINSFSAHCSINQVIRRSESTNPTPTILLTEIHSFLEDTYDTDGIEEEFVFEPTYSDERTPYLNWQTCKWWEYIGATGKFEIRDIGEPIFFIKTSDDTIGGETSCINEDSIMRIGDDNAYIWNKNERIDDKDQPYASLDYDKFESMPWGDRPGTYDARLKLCGTDVVRYNPWYWTKGHAFIAGDAYYGTIRHEKIGHYGTADFKYSGLVPEAKVFSEKPYWVNAFDQNSDDGPCHEFDFGVFRDGERLPDNNTGARAYIPVGNDWLVDDFDVNGVYVLVP